MVTVLLYATHVIGMNKYKYKMGKIGKPKVVGGIKPKGLNTTNVERRGRLVKMDKYS
jgi:hypothetical protein